MFPHPLLVSPFVALLVAAGVYADAGRRSLPRGTRLGWTIGTGIVSLGGFVLAFTLESVLFRAYFLTLGRPVVVHSPSELVTFLFLVGLAVSAVTVLGYGVGSRYGPFKAP